jgi:choline dehydrogenase
MKPSSNYDFVVIGAGSTGCVLANRLTEDPNSTLLLIEAGGPDTKPQIHEPSAWVSLQNTEVDWQYVTEPEAMLNGRLINSPRGKVLGGTSSINAMAYSRGNHQDYDHWSTLGNSGWSYEEVLPYFKKSEDFAGGANRFHGEGGPLKVNYSPNLSLVSQSFIKAATQAGFGEPGWDYNGAEQAGGVGLVQLTIDAKGERSSTAVAFLNPARQRPNLSISTHSHVTRILIENKRAVGVEYLQEGRLHQVRAQREVILSAGAFDSPKLLLLSGIGPAEILRSLDIGVVEDLPGVDQNLQDHLLVLLGYESKQALPTGKGPMIEAWLYTHSQNTRPRTDAPDLQIELLNNVFGSDSQQTPAFSLFVGMVRPQSRGMVSLRSANPLAPVVIRNTFCNTNRKWMCLLRE